ncbi:hypothetical protein BGX33_001389 [Mortierella sp. NVP41]|nr:hypothetical protein BGX33_001389 [Mortierella sp. NVP41]
MAYDFTTTPSKTVKQPWPRLHIQDSGRSPFCYIEPVIKELERPPEAWVDKGGRRQGRQGRQGLRGRSSRGTTHGQRKADPSVMASGIVNSVTSNIVLTSTLTATKPLAATGLQQDRRVK